MRDQPCKHRSTEEVQPHKWLLELEREVWPLNARAQEKQDHSVHEEVRRAKVLRLRGDGGAVTVGLDTPRWQGTRVEANMVSQDGRGVRNCSRKLERAEFYSSRYHRKMAGPRGTRGTSEVDQVELEKALRELGI
jgi:hypothetical protein